MRHIIRIGLFLVVALMGASISYGQDQIAYGAVVRGEIGADESATWSFEAEAGDRVAVFVQRLDGRLTPRIAVLDAGRNPLTPDEAHADADSQRLLFYDGLPAGGVYQIVVTAEDVLEIDGLEQAYTLTLDHLGKQPISADPLPAPMMADMPNLTAGVGRFNDDIDLQIYGDPTITQPDARVERFRFIISDGTRTLDLNNANPISRGISALSFTGGGIGFVATSDGEPALFTDQDINRLDYTQSIYTVDLVNGQTITTDFFQIERIEAIQGVVVVTLTGGGRALLTGDNVRLVRQGGLNQGPNAPRIHEFRADDRTLIATDGLGWDSLVVAVEGGDLVARARYGLDTRFVSDALNLTLLYQAASEEATDRINANIQTEPAITLEIDRQHMGDIDIRGGTLSIQPLDGRSVDENLAGVASVLVENTEILIRRRDGSFRYVPQDATEIETPATIPAAESALPNEADHVPVGFNNLGQHIFDHHPNLTPQHALMPYNRANGNFYYPVQVAATPSHTLALDWTLHYNSLAPSTQTPAYMQTGSGYLYGYVGEGWRHSYQYELDVRYAPLGELRLILPDGALHRFRLSDVPNQFASSSMHTWKIDRLGATLGAWRATTTEGIVYDFDFAGRLQRITDAHGLALLFAPLADGESGFSVAEPYGRRFSVLYDGDGLLASLRTAEEREISFNHSGDRLSAIRYGGDGHQADYAYEGGFLVEIRDTASPYHQHIAVEYDSAGRVIAYTENPDSADDAPPRATRISYDGLTMIETTTVNEQTLETRWTRNNTFTSLNHDLPREGWSYNYEITQGQWSITHPNGTTMRYFVSGENRGYLTEVRDPNYTTNNPHRLSYDSPDGYRVFLREISYSNGYTERFAYDERGRLETLTRIISRDTPRIEQTIRYEYDDYGRIARIIQPTPDGDDNETAFTYDAFGYVASISEGNGSRITSFVHDPNGRLSAITDGRGTTVEISWNFERDWINELNVDSERFVYSYDNHGNMIGYSYQDLTIDYIYNGLNQITSIADPVGYVTTYRYDEMDNLLERLVIEQASGERAEDVIYRYLYIYDEIGNLTHIFTPSGAVVRQSTRFETTANERSVNIADPTGARISYTYDLIERLRRVQYRDLNGDQTYLYRVEYDPSGVPTSVVEAGERTFALRYDLLGRPIEMRVAEQRTAYAYNAAGWLESVTHPDGRITRYEYDLMGNVTAIIRPDNARLAFSYDEIGNMVEFVNAADQVTAYTYDALNRLISIIDNDDRLTSFEYDERGNLTRIVDPQGESITATYDAANRLIGTMDALGGETTNIYNALNQIVRTTQPNFLETAFTYDPNGNLIAERQTGGREMLYGWDVLGRLTSITNTLGHTSLYNYNPINRIGRTINAQGGNIRYSWFASGRQIGMIDVLNRAYSYNWDSMGRLISINDRSLQQGIALNASIDYDAMGWIEAVRFGTSATISDSNNNLAFNYTYNPMGWMESMQTPGIASPWRFTYDAEGHMQTLTDPAGVTTNYAYDAADRVTAVVEAVGTAVEATTRYEYDVADVVKRTIMPDGRVIEDTYDANYRLISRTETAVDGVSRTYGLIYDEVGNITAITDPNGMTTRYGYDNFDDLVSIQRTLTDAEGDAVNLRLGLNYDILGNLIQVTLPGGQTINQTFDTLQQRIRYVDAEINAWTYTYDPAGNLTQISTPLGQRTEYAYDEANRLIALTDANGALTQFTYNNRGHLERITLPPNNDEDASNNHAEIIGYDFDRAGRLIGVRYGPSGDDRITYERDVMGRILRVRDVTGREINLSYDAKGLLLSATSADGSVSFTRTYDINGDMLTSAGRDRTYTFSYDGFGNVATMAFDGFEIDHRYDAAGNLLMQDGGLSGAIRYEYDDLHRPVRIESDDLAVDLTYDANGWITGIERSNGVITTYAYNANGAITSIQHVSADGVRLERFDYTYDPAGNITRITREDNWAVLFSYDNANRLTSERWQNPSSEIVYSETFQYDAAGNRVERVFREGVANPIRTRYVYNNRNQLIEEFRDVPFPIEARFSSLIGLLLILPALWWFRRQRRYLMALAAFVLLGQFVVMADDGPTLTYSYDRNGNLTQISYAQGGSLTLDYDAAQRLRGMNGASFDGDAVSVQVSYDALGQISRIEDSVNQHTYFYDALGFAGRRDRDGGLEVAFRLPSGVPLAYSGGGETRWTLYDGQDMIRRIVDDGGAIIDAGFAGYNVNAFGQLIAPYGESSNAPTIAAMPIFWRGHLYEPESGLYLTPHRAYRPQAGRYLQRNPAHYTPGQTLYAYDGQHAALPAGDMTAASPSPNLPLPVIDDEQVMDSVFDAQAHEFHRILALGDMIRYDVNSIIGRLSPDLCDFYTHLARPMPASARALWHERSNTHLLTASSRPDWLIERPGQTSQAMMALEIIGAAAGAQSMVNTPPVPLNGDCADPFSVPGLPDPLDQHQVYERLATVADHLAETPMIPRELIPRPSTPVIQRTHWHYASVLPDADVSTPARFAVLRDTGLGLHGAWSPSVWRGLSPVVDLTHAPIIRTSEQFEGLSDAGHAMP